MLSQWVIFQKFQFDIYNFFRFQFHVNFAVQSLVSVSNERSSNTEYKQISLIFWGFIIFAKLMATYPLIETKNNWLSDEDSSDSDKTSDSSFNYHSLQLVTRFFSIERNFTDALINLYWEPKSSTAHFCAQF